MRTFIKVVFFLILFSSSSYAQISVRAYTYHPTGDFGFVMKPTFSAEIGYMKPFDDDEWFRPVASISFLVMKPRLASFPTTGILSDGAGDHILPGRQSFQKYNIGQVFLGFDVPFIKKDPFYAYAGLDITIGGASVEYTDSVPLIKNETYSGGGFLGGFRFRLGAEYNFNDNIGIFINAQRSVWLITEPKAFNWANDYGIGVKYTFD